MISLHESHLIQRPSAIWTRLALPSVPSVRSEGVVALGADPSGTLHLGAVDDLLARVALDPEALGDMDAARLALRPVGPIGRGSCTWGRPVRHAPPRRGR